MRKEASFVSPLVLERHFGKSGVDGVGLGITCWPIGNLVLSLMLLALNI